MLWATGSVPILPFRKIRDLIDYNLWAVELMITTIRLDMKLGEATAFELKLWNIGVLWDNTHSGSQKLKPQREYDYVHSTVQGSPKTTRHDNDIAKSRNLFWIQEKKRYNIYIVKV